MKFAKLSALFILALAVSACSSTQTSETRLPSHSFTAMAASGDHFEIASSKIALDKSHNKQVRKIARRLIDDHTSSSKDLQKLVADNNLRPLPPRMEPPHQHMLDQLVHSKNFDHDYLIAQERAHQEAIGMFENCSQNSGNPALRDFAGKTLPTLQEHYRMIEKALGKTQED